MITQQEHAEKPESIWWMYSRIGNQIGNVSTAERNIIFIGLQSWWLGADAAAVIQCVACECKTNGRWKGAREMVNASTSCVCPKDARRPTERTFILHQSMCACVDLMFVMFFFPFAFFGWNFLHYRKHMYSWCLTDALCRWWWCPRNLTNSLLFEYEYTLRFFVLLLCVIFGDLKI